MAKGERRVNSKRKGSRGERMAAKFLRELGYVNCMRTAQVAANPAIDFSADLMNCIPNVRVEVKFGYNHDLTSKAVLGWTTKIAQETPENEKWVILYKRPYKPWLCIYEVDGILVGSLDAKDGVAHVEHLANTHVNG